MCTGTQHTDLVQNLILYESSLIKQYSLMLNHMNLLYSFYDFFWWW